MADYDTYPSDPAYGYGVLFATFLISFVVCLVIALAYYVLQSFALMSFFHKVGVKPWIAWVPYYNTWTWLQVGGQKGVYTLFVLIPYGGIVTSVFLYIGMHRTGIAFGRDIGMLVLGVFLPPVWLFMLGAQSEVYRPELISAAGYPAPLAGFGSPPNPANTGEPGSPIPDPVPGPPAA